MTNLTDAERDAVVEYLFGCETAFLVENLMNCMDEQDLKALGTRLVAEQTDTESVSSETLDGIYTNAMHLAHHLRIAGMNDEADFIERFGIEHGRRLA